MDSLFWIEDGSIPPLDKENGRGRSDRVILDMGETKDPEERYLSGFYDYCFNKYWVFDYEDWVDEEEVDRWCDPTNFRTW